MNKIQLCDIYSCTQCRACEQVCPKHCISFVEGKDGFEFPHIDTDLCIECGACVKSCHQLSLTKEKNQPLYAYAAWSNDEQVRTTSSSGGVFSEIARYVFEKNGVVAGAVMDEDLKVRHTFATDMESLFPMRGSKYVQSDLRGVYSKIKEYLRAEHFVLFTGTPCQVAGLYPFLKKDYPNLLTCDLVCHGVPSQKSFDTYCEKTGLKDKVVEVAFRYTKGWGLQMASRKHLESTIKPNASKWNCISPRKSYYLRAFTGGLMFDESCYNCHYATPQRVSDLTMADYWGIGTMVPFSHPKKKGISLLLVNSEKGKAVVGECQDLFIVERPFGEAAQGNHNLSQCSDRPQERETYCQDAETMPIDALIKKYRIEPSFKDYLRPLKRRIIK